jgi:signal transduction histidine kinase
VQDHGPGVPADQRERIFEKFYRLPGASERSGGVGLGLSLVRSIAEQHGGTVRATARLDGAEGACFELRLPL